MRKYAFVDKNASNARINNRINNRSEHFSSSQRENKILKEIEILDKDYMLQVLNNFEKKRPNL